MRTSRISCQILSESELERKNREASCQGISEECKEAVEKIRDDINKGKVPTRHDDATMQVLRRRVESNVDRYINGSNTPRKTAISELWKWYLIFKELRPDDEVPMNPCRSCITHRVFRC